MTQTKKATEKSTDNVDIAKATKEISQTNHPKNEVVTALQTQVANAFVIYTNYKHYHWQTFGPLFRDLHHLFDELAAEVYATVDELAERVRMIGQNPVSRLDDMVKIATIKPAKSEGNMREMIAEGHANTLVVIKEMRDAVETASDQGDPGTADVFTRFVQIHEKHEWFLREFLEKRDGLTEITDGKQVKQLN
jgi:starvation-inducible DNA-binding protein